MRRNTSTYLAGIVCTASLLLLGPDRRCYADLLNFQFDPNGPTILATNGSLSYDASTGEFQGTALPLTLSSPLLPGSGTVSFSGDSQLSFDFFVNPDGTFRSDPDGFNLTGTLSIDGTKISGGLLSGDFYDFGAEPAGPPTWVSNALLDTTGGLLATYLTVVGEPILPPLFPKGDLQSGSSSLSRMSPGGTSVTSRRASAPARSTSRSARPRSPSRQAGYLRRWGRRPELFRTHQEAARAGLVRN